MSCVCRWDFIYHEQAKTSVLLGLYAVRLCHAGRQRHVRCAGTSRWCMYPGDVLEHGDHQWPVCVGMWTLGDDWRPPRRRTIHVAGHPAGTEFLRPYRQVESRGRQQAVQLVREGRASSARPQTLQLVCSNRTRRCAGWRTATQS